MRAGLDSSESLNISFQTLDPSAQLQASFKNILVFFFVLLNSKPLGFVAAIMGMQQIPSTRLPATSDLAAMLAASSGSLTNAVLISAILQGSMKLPEMFVEVEDDRASVCAQSSELLDVPVIDLSKLWTGGETDRQSVVCAMAEACEKWGFLQVANHGVDLKLIARCQAQAHRLFERPLEAKERAHRPPGEKFGYGANTWVDQTVRHWAESFSLQLHPYSNIAEYASKLFESEQEDFRYCMMFSSDCKLVDIASSFA